MSYHRVKFNDEEERDYFEKLLSAMSDGKEHDIHDVGKKISLPQDGVKKIVNFLIKYNFLECGVKKNTVKLDARTLKLFREIA